MGALVNGIQIGSPAQTPNKTQWQQCPNWMWTPAQGAQVDTRAYVPHSGQLTLKLFATNAAGVTSSTGTWRGMPSALASCGESGWPGDRHTRI